ncbi:chorismate synthase [Chloroflexi bacterium]|nr:chorismate synthase [Chloroflexota bacterium]
MSNTFGKAFKITTWGESHGDAVGVVIDGCPPGLPINLEDIQKELDRRKPGQSEISTQRKEGDKAEILSGVFEGVSLGTPISISVWNGDARGKDYEHMKSVYRPSHADYTYQAKYGVRNWKGGGRASARETIGRVAAGAIAKKFLRKEYGTEIFAFVKRISDIESNVNHKNITAEAIESNIARCPDKDAALSMIEAVKTARKNGDSLGGVVEAFATNVPVGIGEPVFDKLDAELAKAMLSLPACKGFEIGSGFDGTYLTGSQHNDSFYMSEGTVRTKTNNSGGIQGGISNGESIVLRAGFKPTATIMSSQDTVDVFGNNVELQGRGRHDPCVLPRAVPIVESMFALVLCDHAIRHRGQTGK